MRLWFSVHMAHPLCRPTGAQCGGLCLPPLCGKQPDAAALALWAGGGISGCCNSDDACFMRDAFYSECRSACPPNEAGPAWQCSMSPPSPPTSPPAPPLPPPSPPWAPPCVAAGATGESQNCVATDGCCGWHATCYTRDVRWGECHTACPEGWDCTIVSPSRSQHYGTQESITAWQVVLSTLSKWLSTWTQSGASVVEQTNALLSDTWGLADPSLISRCEVALLLAIGACIALRGSALCCRRGCTRCSRLFASPSASPRGASSRAKSPRGGSSRPVPRHVQRRGRQRVPVSDADEDLTTDMQAAPNHAPPPHQCILLEEDTIAALQSIDMLAPEGDAWGGDGGASTRWADEPNGGNERSSCGPWCDGELD